MPRGEGWYVFKPRLDRKGAMSSYQSSKKGQLFSFVGSNLGFIVFLGRFGPLHPRDSTEFRKFCGANIRCLDWAGFQPVSLDGHQLLSHIGSQLGLFVLKSPKMAAFSSPPAQGARITGTMLLKEAVLTKFQNFISWGARNYGTMCLEQVVLTKFQNGMGWGGGS